MPVASALLILLAMEPTRTTGRSELDDDRRAAPFETDDDLFDEPAADDAFDYEPELFRD